MSETSTILVERCLERLKMGDPKARDDLIRHASDRLERLTRKMMGDYRTLRRWEESADVYQNALIRLCRALKDIVPPTPKDFFRFAALQIRWELVELARHHYQGEGAKHACVGPDDQRSGVGTPMLEPGEVTNDPARVDQWTEFH